MQNHIILLQKTLNITPRTTKNVYFNILITLVSTYTIEPICNKYSKCTNISRFAALLLFDWPLKGKFGSS